MFRVHWKASLFSGDDWEQVRAVGFKYTLYNSSPYGMLHTLFKELFRLSNSKCLGAKSCISWGSHPRGSTNECHGPQGYLLPPLQKVHGQPPSHTYTPAPHSPPIPPYCTKGQLLHNAGRKHRPHHVHKQPPSQHPVHTGPQAPLVLRAAPPCLSLLEVGAGNKNWGHGRTLETLVAAAAGVIGGVSAR